MCQPEIKKVEWKNCSEKSPVFVKKHERGSTGKADSSADRGFSHLSEWWKVCDHNRSPAHHRRKHFATVCSADCGVSLFPWTFVLLFQNPLSPWLIIFKINSPVFFIKCTFLRRITNDTWLFADIINAAHLLSRGFNALKCKAMYRTVCCLFRNLKLKVNCALQGLIDKTLF